MKAPEYKGPAQLWHGNYAENCKLITLPKGYRFLKVGEKSEAGDFHTPFGDGKWENNGEAGCVSDVIKGHMWPHIRKVGYVRGPKGRFVSAKPVPPAPKPETKEKPLVTIYAEGTGPSRKYRVEHGGAQLEEGDKELLKGIDTFRSVSKELADLKAWKAKVLAAI